MGDNRFEPIQIKEETEPVFPVLQQVSNHSLLYRKS